ncbi:iron-containing redox enzyme family protein [Leptolyngbya sp. 7M]|uniref:iron-containing redox enzyme family protein n=1 Tax=Leptolyngbya sp. 7M TaxID=2812896 RepID=UPI001B8C463B|nr:iron-containing redox enzyme family protein [Leptolyngbya sp. 7M]QYO67098.1 iron-containing redox enzyme family protein [Leptolyngbya sp. 7M]
MEWLLNLAEEYRAGIRSGRFFRELERIKKPEEVKGWIHQLYYQSRDFTSALSMRYAMCKDPRFQGCFAKHAMEEVDHCDQLLAWMRKHNFLAPNESPTHTLPTLETSLVSAYCFRSVLRESYAHQVIAMNLISEGVSYDFFSAVNPKLKSLGLSVGHYWQVHKEIDQQHLALGLDLIPQCEKDSDEGQIYTQTAWEMATLYQKMLDSWSEIPSTQFVAQTNQKTIPALF